MKTILSKSLLALFISLLLPVIAFAEVNIRKIDLNPSAYSVLEPHISLWPTPKGTRVNLIEVEFYPLGFSNKGQFAYLIVPPDEAQGFLTVELVVQNLVTDKVVFKKTYRFEGGRQSKDYPRDFKTFIHRYKNKINRIKSRYGIANQMPYFNTCFGDFELALKREFNPEDGLGDFLSHLELQIKNKKGKLKTVYNKKVRGRVYNTAIAGFFASPYEQRIAIVLLDIRRGWEGLPNTTGVRVIGVSLKSGFH
ncbi:MAG: hypothetical protein KAH22_03045 [Thiotrichaceae bacterium]|nr:hypothetical protein [Thiotrichaceae bacterium]